MTSTRDFLYGERNISRSSLIPPTCLEKLTRLDADKVLVKIFYCAYI